MIGWRVLNQELRQISILGLASVVSGGLVGGLGGRLAMTISARAAGTDMAGRLTENGNTIGVFTVGGTIALVVFVGLLGGMLGSVGVVAADPWLRWAGPFKGLGYGVVALTFLGYQTFDSVDFVILEPAALNVGMFLVLLLGFGLVVVGIARVLGRRLPEAADQVQAGWALFVALGSIPLLMTVLLFASPSFCGCEPDYGIGVSLLVMIIATAVFHLDRVYPATPTWALRTAKLAGHIALVVGMVLGSLHIVDDVRRLF